MIGQVLKSKFLGALIGTGVGDTLGAPFEGWSKVKLEKIEEVAEKREVLTCTDDARPILQCVNLIAKEGKLTLVSADGFRLAMISLDYADCRLLCYIPS